ncbi:hypothetical protein EJ110_NYTH41895 [Nymphaea thermarum]|nr:hypothetical protein EJ110_NYTH41895 [Nymphaea thermarum]
MALFGLISPEPMAIGDAPSSMGFPSSSWPIGLRPDSSPDEQTSAALRARRREDMTLMFRTRGVPGATTSGFRMDEVPNDGPFALNSA